MLSPHRFLPRSLSIKLLVIFELVLLIAIVALLIPVKNRMRDQITVGMQNELRAIVGTAALQLNGDVVSAAQKEGPGQSQAIAQTREVLNRIRIVNTLRPENIYTFYREGDRVFEGVGPAENMVRRSDARSEMIDAFTVGIVSTTDLHDDPSAGETISAYAPIRNSAGEIVSILEVNRKADEYFALYRYAMIRNVLMALIALGISSVLGWFVLNLFVIDPIAKLKEAMIAMGRQDFRHRVKLHTGDELQELGDTLNKMSEQLNAARAVQESFIPKTLPSQSGYRIAAATEPCEATAGDYFDAFALDENRVAVLVADVTGHGLGPSLLMSACRSSLRALSTADLSPAQILDRLDELLRGDLVEGRFITMIFGVLDANGTFTFANAGHGPALIVLSGACTELTAHRPPLGVEASWSEEDEPTQTSYHMQIGDRVFLCSDGVSEAMNSHGEQFGIERIRRLVRDRSSDHAQVVERVRQAIREHCGGPAMKDDITILCVERVAEGAADRT